MRALLFAALLCAAVAQLINTSRSNIKRMVMKTVDNSGEASTWSFDEIKLTETEVEVVETEEGDAKVSKRPGKAKYSNIVLSKAAMDGSIAQWWSKVGVVFRSFSKPSRQFPPHQRRRG